MRSDNICKYCANKNDASKCCHGCYNHNRFEGIEVKEDADAKPMKYGKWLKPDMVTSYLMDENNNSEPLDSYYCSECGFEVTGRTISANGTFVLNYCPNCGARMDGGK